MTGSGFDTRLASIVAIVALALALGVGSFSHADIVHLNNGGQVQGHIVDETDDTIVIKTKFGEQTLFRDDIERIERLSDPPAEFRQRAKKLQRGGDAGAWFDLGVWAKDKRLEKEAAEAFGRAIELDPDHQASRKALGYKKILGKWLTRDEVKQREGYVLHEGEWIKPEDKEKIDQGYIRVEDEWVKKDLYEARKQREETLRRKRAEERARAAKNGGTPPASGTPGGAGIVRVPPPPKKAPSKDKQERLVEAQRGRAREAERTVGVTFEDVEEGPLLIHTTQAKDSERFRTFLRDLGKLYKAETKVYNIPFEEPIWPGKLQIFFFADKSQFDRFATSFDGAGGAVNSGGYFIEGESTAGYSKFHIAMYNLDTGTLAHELSHAFMARYDYSSKRVIPWVNEGVAEFLRIYTALDLQIGKSGGGRRDGVVSQMIARGDNRASLGHMMGKQDIAGTEGWAYAVSWSLVDFMVKADKKAFVKFLKNMKQTDGTFSDRWKNQTVEQQRAAIEDAYGVSLEKFETLWKEHVRGGK